MRPWHPVRSFVLPALVLGLVVGCGGGGAGVSGSSSRRVNTAPTITGWAVNPNTATLVRYQSYTFTIQVSDPDIGDKLSKMEWDFGTGSIITTTTNSLDYSLTKTGSQTIKVRAFDSGGGTSEWASFTVNVDSSPTPITASFTSPAAALTVVADLGAYAQVVYSVHVESTSTTPIALSGLAFNPGEAGATIVSSQSDGSGDYTFVVRYSADVVVGTRTVTPSLLVTDAAKVSSDVVSGPAITISTLPANNHAPVLTVTNPSSPSTSGFTTKPVPMSFVVSDPDGDAVAYTVDWGDGTPVARAIVSGNTTAGVTVSLTHVFPDAFTSTTRSSLVKISATDNRSTNSQAIDQTRTFNIQYNAYPTATITTPQASGTLPANGTLTGGVPSGFVNPPGANDPDIVVIPNGGKLTFVGAGTPPGSGEAALIYAWSFPNGVPATSAAASPGDVVFTVQDGTIVPVLVELTVKDAFGRFAAAGPLASAKTYRKWVVVDGVNTQNFQMSFMYRQKSDNNATVSLVPAKTAANGYGSNVEVFQDGVTNTFPVQNSGGQAVVTVPVRSNLPFYIKLASFGTDTRNYLIRIPNAPTGPFADPGLVGNGLNDYASSFGFLNATAPFNPALQIVTGEGFASETASTAERRLQGTVYAKSLPGFPPAADPLNMVIGNIPANGRYLDRLSVPMPTGDPLKAIQWTQSSNNIVNLQDIHANQLFGEWVALLLNEAPKDALTGESPVDTESSAIGTNADFGFVVDYAGFVGDSAKSKTFTQTKLEAFRVPPGVTDPYDLSIAGWDTSATTVLLNPTQISATISSPFDIWVNGGAGASAFSGGLQGFAVYYDANDPDRIPITVPNHYLFAPVRSVFSYAEYLWSSVWARPLVMNRAHLSWSEDINVYPYFRRSNPTAWPAKNAIVPDNSSFNMNVNGAGTFDPHTAPVGLSGATAASTGVGRFYWAAYTPHYNPAGGAVVSRTWLSTAFGDPPTTFSGGTGDATAGFGFIPPQDIVVDKRSRNANGSLSGQSLGGYRLTWFNPTVDSTSNPVPPDFWVVEMTAGGKTHHFMLPGSFPMGTQSASDLLLTDSRTFLPSGNSAAAGPAANDKVAPGYCWFDIPTELRPDAGIPGQSATLRVFAVKAILKNAPPSGSRALTAADWIEAIKTVTANVKIATNAGDVAYAHKVPFNYYWDIVVVNGPQTFVAP